MLDDVHYPEPDPNKRPAADVWNERYQGDAFFFGKEPALALKNLVGSLRPGKVMDVAMGEGRNTVFLAQNGFNAEGVDCSSKAIEKAKNLAEEKKVSIDVKTQNLDFFLMPLMKYDSVVMTYFRPLPRFFSEIKRGLVMGGTFLLEAYTTEQMKHTPPSHLEFSECYQPNELIGHLKEFQILYYNELAQGSSHVVQVLAQKKKP